MSCFFRLEGEDVWNPSNFVARLFIEEARTLARLLEVESGIGDIVDDECELSTKEFLNFTIALAERHWNTNNPTLKDLLAAVTGINCVLLDRVGQDFSGLDSECRDFWRHRMHAISRGMPQG
ncbi:DUF6086 family protein [Streptomyces sp. NPDC059474]|uniref:DUF6086 family protein n=1 Tax=unclassified Streptomyces TaxID=2593676 RepID=UPI0033DDF730